MLLRYPEYQKRYCQTLLLLTVNIPSDVSKYILHLYQLIIETEIKPIKEHPDLTKFYLKFNNDIKLNLFVENNRKIIHEFCEQHNLISKSEYKRTETIIARKCTYCNRWTDKHEEGRGDTVFWCDSCLNDEDGYGVVGCESCDDIDELIEDKEIKFAYKCNGNMLIMRKNNIVSGYKKSGNYRNRPKKHII